MAERINTLKKHLIISKTKCKTYITFDCCHSGSALDLYYNLSIQKNKLIHSYELLNKNKKNSSHNIIMISGCMDNQTSEENKYQNQIGGEFLQMGTMTSTLIKILKKYKFNISIGSLMVEMNKYMLRDKKLQIPVFSSNQAISLSKSFLNLSNNNSKREYKDAKENNDKKIKNIIKKIIKKEIKKLLKKK
jgi:predicted DNA-binding WGR domain protein